MRQTNGQGFDHITFFEKIVSRERSNRRQLFMCIVELFKKVQDKATFSINSLGVSSRLQLPLIHTVVIGGGRIILALVKLR